MGGDGGQLDLFSVSAIDPPWRDNRDAMEFPFLSLQKRRTTPIEYEENGVHVSVGADSRFSIATIWDWDVMIFAASHLNEAIESRRKVSPQITFVPHDCLKQIGRPIGGEHYRRLAEAIRRLYATTVITNIREADQPERGKERPFHWLMDYAIPKRYGRRIYTTPDNITHITPEDPEGEADPGRSWEMELHPWLYNAIVRQGDILAVHPDYFQLTGGLERWLYRLARKAVPDKAEPPAIRFKMETLHARSGVTRDLKRFAFDIREIAKTQPLPEYGVQVEYRKGRRELVTLYRDKAKPCRPQRGRRLKTLRGERLKPAVNTDTYLEAEDVFVIAPTQETGAPPLAKIADASAAPLATDQLAERRRELSSRAQPDPIKPDSLPAITPRPTITVEHVHPAPARIADAASEPPAEPAEEAPPAADLAELEALYAEFKRLVHDPAGDVRQALEVFADALALRSRLNMPIFHFTPTPGRDMDPEQVAALNRLLTLLQSPPQRSRLG